jgi:tRNA threonylcarbamoyladenosine biosynthesis protein TsaB
MRQVGWKPTDVQLVAVGIGPGSFTGLRLGVMTAKAFAYAAGSAILGVGTPDAIAARAPRELRRIAVAIDAQRGEVYSARFTLAAGDVIDVTHEGATEIITVESWLASLTSDVLATGPALAKLAGEVPSSAVLAPRDVWFPDAASVGRLASVRATRGDVDDLWMIAPLYLRRSAAEEKWDSRAT